MGRWNRLLHVALLLVTVLMLCPSSTQAAEPLKDVPRNRTLIYTWTSYPGPHLDWDLWNPYALGADHQTGTNVMFEPVAYYSDFTDKEYLWLAESYSYSPDYKQLTIKTRQGITWSDGAPFSAADVAYTLDTLRQMGPKIKWGVDVQEVVDKVSQPDANTVVVDFKVPAPRFFEFMTFKEDIGVYIVPKHIFEGQDWMSFKNYDPAKGWPVTTSAWKLVFSSPEKKIWDRRDDWWAAKTGIAPLPKVERLINTARPNHTKLSQLVITDEMDICEVLVENLIAVTQKNPKVTTFSGQKSPYGSLSWWPISLFVNASKPPYDVPDVRWALSYFIDRKQVIDVGYGGNNAPAELPMAPFKGLQPYFDSVKDLLDKYPTLKYDPAKGAELLTNKGFKKGSDGIWVDPKGNRLEMDIICDTVFVTMAPVVVEQLKRNGVAATFSTPPDIWDRIAKKDYVGAINGNAGSVKDPYLTLRLFQNVVAGVPGTHEVNVTGWANADYDKIVDKLATTTDPATVTDLFHQAMSIYLPELPCIQLVQYYHHLPLNTTYWKNWPSEQNPYMMPGFFALTWPFVLAQLEPAQ